MVEDTSALVQMHVYPQESIHQLAVTNVDWAVTRYIRQPLALPATFSRMLHNHQGMGMDCLSMFYLDCLNDLEMAQWLASYCSYMMLNGVGYSSFLCSSVTFQQKIYPMLGRKYVNRNVV